MKINLIDYKGKYYIYQDADFELDNAWDFVEDTIESEEITNKDFLEHLENCQYYGIPAYIGRDKRLNSLQDKFYEEQDKLYERPTA